MSILPERWDEIVSHEEPRLDLGSLASAIDGAYAAYPGRVNPARDRVFRALELPLEEVRVVLLGQDPYPGRGVADGLAFSTLQGTTPASLRNIHREICSELGQARPVCNDLTYLFKQGVLLYNTSLISLEGKPLFFAKIPEFKLLSGAVISALSKLGKVVFMLLGRQAQAFAPLVDTERNALLMAAHPSPLSAAHGFFGSGIFTACNEKLIGWGFKPIQWLA